MNKICKKLEEKNVSVIYFLQSPPDIFPYLVPKNILLVTFKEFNYPGVISVAENTNYTDIIKNVSLLYPSIRIFDNCFSDLPNHFLSLLNFNSYGQLFNSTLNRTIEMLFTLEDKTIFKASSFQSTFSLDYLPFCSSLIFNILIRQGILEFKNHDLYSLNKNIMNEILLSVKNIGEKRKEENRGGRDLKNSLKKRICLEKSILDLNESEEGELIKKVFISQKDVSSTGEKDGKNKILEILTLKFPSCDPPEYSISNECLCVKVLDTEIELERTVDSSWEKASVFAISFIEKLANKINSAEEKSCLNQILINGKGRKEYLQLLNEYCQRSGFQAPNFDYSERENKTFTCTCIIENIQIKGIKKWAKKGDAKFETAVLIITLLSEKIKSAKNCASALNIGPFLSYTTKDIIK